MILKEKLTVNSLNRIKRIKLDLFFANPMILPVNIYFDENPNKDSFDQLWFYPKTNPTKK